MKGKWRDEVADSAMNVTGVCSTRHRHRAGAPTIIGFLIFLQTNQAVQDV